MLSMKDTKHCMTINKDRSMDLRTVEKFPTTDRHIKLRTTNRTKEDSDHGIKDRSFYGPTGLLPVSVSHISIPGHWGRRDYFTLIYWSVYSFNHG